LFDRPKPTAGCSANGRRRRRVKLHLVGDILEYISDARTHEREISCQHVVTEATKRQCKESPFRKIILKYIFM